MFMPTMTISQLVNVFCCLLPLIYGEHLCEYENVQELIKTSPVILKALGARIFADSTTDELTPDITTTTSSLSSSSSSLSLSSAASTTTLITLTPETLYKGASVLKVAQIADGGEYYEYEGQLNATVNPLEKCFNSRILSLLPTQLIAFGKLDSDHPDVLKLTANGLHKWNPEFESRIWKYLGWDDWSDFTLCSVTCGKGVQQRFRRCLLDTPKSSSPSASTDYYPPRLKKINERSNNRGSSSKKYTTENKMKKSKRRKGKGLSTLSCEGYNIEQRNCNMFECNDDISDLLKFYKKFFYLNETSAVLETTSVPALSTSVLTTTTTGGTKRGGGSLPHGWNNSVNFTLMTTLRAKNHSHATIVSLRNATHNLYLDQSRNGLKLFQERDDVTEMLPIKLDLYDNHWHQIAISVHNGDFITVYVDCLWTNSFVVSKRLFALPDGADVEVGRGFNGDLQQLLILPGNHERLQCSTVRTSINEVKRYIIDTFIDDDN